MNSSHPFWGNFMLSSDLTQIAGGIRQQSVTQKHNFEEITINNFTINNLENIENNKVLKKQIENHTLSFLEEEIKTSAYAETKKQPIFQSQNNYQVTINNFTRNNLENIENNKPLKKQIGNGSDKFTFLEEDIKAFAYTETDFSYVSPQDSIVRDYQIDALLSDYKWGFSWGSNQLTYSFYSDSVFGGSYYGSQTGVREVSDGVKDNVRQILSWLGNVINIDFVEVAESSNNFGRLRFMLSDGPSYAYAYYPFSDSNNNNIYSLAGDVHLNPKYDRFGDTNGFQHYAGRHGYETLIHEIGHALGLEHSHEGNYILPKVEDHNSNTVMTYKPNGNSAGTYMAYDIKALQYLYGAKEYNNDDTLYRFTGRIDQFYVNDQLYLETPHLTKQLIWDSGGVDTLDFSQLSLNSSGYRFDLNPGGFLSTKAAYNSSNQSITYGTAIAYDVWIENIIISSSNDYIFANSVANTFSGYDPNRITGHDVYWNTSSLDTLDLSSYSFSSIIQTQNANDLFLDLGTNGSITVKDYYIGQPLTILFGDSITASINNVSLLEGDSGLTPAVFTVTLSGPSLNTITLEYATADGTATAGSDYIATSGLLTFAPGETIATIIVDIIGDTVYEADETFYVNLSNPSGNVVIVDGQGIGTIINDDVYEEPIINDIYTPPIININNVTEFEGDPTGRGRNRITTTPFDFTVTLSHASDRVVTVMYATEDGTANAGSDYLAITGILTFNPGETEKTITVSIYRDTTVEDDEYFFVNLSNSTDALLGNAQGLGTILNDDYSNKRNNPRNSNELFANNVVDFNLGNTTPFDNSNLDPFAYDHNLLSVANADSFSLASVG